MSISVIIPTFNEEKNIARTVEWLQATRSEAVQDIIVVDGGGQDETIALAAKAGALAIKSPKKGRAAQMNHGANIAKGSTLYFVHADVLPPKSWASDLMDAVGKDRVAGCFSYRFDRNKWYLKINEWASRQHWLAVGSGDQTMFVNKDIFMELSGFKEGLHIMEDFDFVKRLRKKYSYDLICKNATVSARKYDHNNYFFVQTVNALVVLFFILGFPQERLTRVYRSVLKKIR